MTMFVRLLDAPVDDKASQLRAAIASMLTSSAGSESRPTLLFDRDPSSFRGVPGTPFPYWASDTVMALFSQMPPFARGENTVKQGLASGDDFRLMRLWWESSLPGSGVASPWTSVSKGGCTRPFYADLPLLIGYAKAHQVAIQQIGRFGRGASHYYLPGLTYTLRASRFRPQALPANVITTVRGSGIYASPSPAPYLALLNSSTADYLLKLMLGRGAHPQFDMGDIAALPIPDVVTQDGAELALIARRAWSAQRSLDTNNEVSHAFLLPRGLNEKVTGLDRAAMERELELLQKRIDEAAFALYGLGPDDRAAIDASCKRAASNEETKAETSGSDYAEVDEAPVGADADEVNSWLVEVAFARFDPRLATGERPIPREPEPFDPLPSRSPGMYPEGEEPADRPDILVDDEGHTDDLAARAQAMAERVQVDVPEDLRAWLAKDFFPLHIKMYSKSRRKAPIYWQLATPSASYSVWLYIHAFSKDTLFRVQNDYVAPKLAHEERRLDALTLEQRDGATAAERKALAEQQTLVEELQGFLAEVKRVAPLWKPNLDDGVIINFSLLWRLMLQHKPWQKELKKSWDALCEGKYDWAHLAMHLWPERVVPKCTKDRSLAIAHDMEDVFWEEDSDGKWQPVKVPQTEIYQLIVERTSAAVKDALQSLLDAPPPATGRGGGRRASGRGSAHRTRSTTNRPITRVSAAPDPGVMAAIKEAIEAVGDGASKADVLAATGLTDAQWNAAINSLLAQGSVDKSGAGRGTRYHSVKQG